MNNAEVDLSDVVAVIVQQADNTISVASGDVELFVDFTLDSGEIGFATEGVGPFIDRIDVPANSDGSLGVKAAFATAFTPGVVEVATLVMKEGVGNDLLEGGVFLGLAPVHEEVVGWVEDGFKVFEDIGLNALKGSEFVKEFPWDDEDFLPFVIAHIDRS